MSDDLGLGILKSLLKGGCLISLVILAVIGLIWFLIDWLLL